MDTDINQVVARALRWHMDRAGLTELALGRQAGVSPRTVANFLRPETRTTGSRGKPPSGKLTELALIAKALNASVADLVCDLSGAERESRRRVLAAVHVLQTGEPPPRAWPAPPAAGKRGAKELPT